MFEAMSSPPKQEPDDITKLKSYSIHVELDDPSADGFKFSASVDCSGFGEDSYSTVCLANEGEHPFRSEERFDETHPNLQIKAWLWRAGKQPAVYPLYRGPSDWTPEIGYGLSDTEYIDFDGTQKMRISSIVEKLVDMIPDSAGTGFVRLQDDFKDVMPIVTISREEDKSLHLMLRFLWDGYAITQAQLVAFLHVLDWQEV